MQKYAQKNIFENIFFSENMFHKIFFSEKSNNKVCKYWDYLNLNLNLNPLEPPKPPKKSKKVIFRDLKIRAGVLKVALKYFLLVFGQKFFRRHLPYLHAGKVNDLGHL